MRASVKLVHSVQADPPHHTPGEHVQGTFQNFVGLSAGGRGPVCALMGPWTHRGKTSVIDTRIGVRISSASFSAFNPASQETAYGA
jgi:hypothetical protein